MRSISKSYMKHCLILWPHTLLTYFVFGWVVEASAACFIGCLAHVPWWRRGLDAGSSLASFSTASLLCIDNSVTLMILTCITAHMWCSFTSHCFPTQCCSIATCHIAMICKHVFSTSTLLNSEGFWYVDLLCSCSQQFGLLTKLTECSHSCATGGLAICRRESMIKSFICKKSIICEYVDALNCQWGLKSFSLRHSSSVLHCWILWLQSRLM